MKKLPLQKALTQILGSLNRPVVTDYQLGRIIHTLYTEKSYKGKEIRVAKQAPDRRDYQRYLKSLLDSGILSDSRSFPSKRVFKILGPHTDSPKDIICSIDPFSYISHFSAMEYYGLTDKIVKTLFYSTLTHQAWREASTEKMIQEIGELHDYQLPALRFLMPEKLGKTTVHCLRTKTAGGFQKVADSPLRVSKIGRTFLDMLQRPDLCGGIYNVIDVFKDNAEQYFNLIYSSIDRHGKDIDKVRAGYIFEEHCGIKNDEIDQWQTFAQRGGSRKLDATQGYSHIYSEKWCLSINIET